MPKWTDLTQEQRLEHIREFDSLYMDLYNKAKESNLSDEQFSKEHKEEALKIVELYSEYRAKPTFHNLTNSNNHFLVKVLNYNNFFKLPKKFKLDLKQIALIT